MAPSAQGSVAPRPEAATPWNDLTARRRGISIPGWAAHALPWVFLLALAVRLVNLTFHSLWYDEIVSTFWAARPASEILRVGLALTEDKHPPFYYLLLRGWTLLFGPGDFSVRSLGATIGALAVLPAYGIGTRLGGRRAGALAALFLAVNPFLVWYSQEARMFMPATAFALAGLYGLLRLMESGRPGAFCLLVLGLLAALYSYLYSAFLLPLAGLWLLLLWWLDRRQHSAGRRFWLSAAGLAVVAVLFLPLAQAAWHVSGVEAEHGRAFEGMLAPLWGLLKVYTLGWPSWDTRLVAAVAAAAGALALAGCMLPGEREQHPGGLLVTLWFVVVILIGGYLLGRDRRVFAETRYQIVLVPALCLAWGRGLSRLWAWRRPAGMASLVLMLGFSVAALPFDWSLANRREDWRDAAAFVEAHAGPNDAVLIQADYVHIAFERYFRGPQPVYYPFTDRLTDPARVDPPLAGLAGFDAVWVVQSHQADLDPGNLVLGWFGARYPQITEVYPTGIAVHAYLQHYRTPGPPAGESGPAPLAAFGPLRLLGCTYQPATLPARDDRLHPPSNWIHVVTAWTVDGQGGSGDLVPRARLVDNAGQVWGESLDWPGGAFKVWPTSHWLPGETVRADYDVNLNPDTPGGVYHLVVQVPGMGQTAACGDAVITR